jgi:hypothetical protein
MLQTVAHYGGREGRYFAPNSKYCEPNIGNRKEQNTCSCKPFFLGMTDTISSQNIDLSSWDTLHKYNWSSLISGYIVRISQNYRAFLRAPNSA